MPPDFVRPRGEGAPATTQFAQNPLQIIGVLSLYLSKVASNGSLHLAQRITASFARGGMYANMNVCMQVVLIYVVI